MIGALAALAALVHCAACAAGSARLLSLLRGWKPTPGGCDDDDAAIGNALEVLADDSAVDPLFVEHQHGVCAMDLLAARCAAPGLGALLYAAVERVRDLGAAERWAHRREFLLAAIAGGHCDAAHAALDLGASVADAGMALPLGAACWRELLPLVPAETLNAALAYPVEDETWRRDVAFLRQERPVDESAAAARKSTEAAMLALGIPSRDPTAVLAALAEAHTWTETHASLLGAVLALRSHAGKSLAAAGLALAAARGSSRMAVVCAHHSDASAGNVARALLGFADAGRSSTVAQLLAAPAAEALLLSTPIVTTADGRALLAAEHAREKLLGMSDALTVASTGLLGRTVLERLMASQGDGQLSAEASANLGEPWLALLQAAHAHAGRKPAGGLHPPDVVWAALERTESAPAAAPWPRLVAERLAELDWMDAESAAAQLALDMKNTGDATACGVLDEARGQPRMVGVLAGLAMYLRAHTDAVRRVCGADTALFLSETARSAAADVAGLAFARDEEALRALVAPEEGAKENAEPNTQRPFQAVKRIHSSRIPELGGRMTCAASQAGRPLCIN